MELAVGFRDFSIQLGLDAKLFLSPESVEDVCYSIFATFRGEGNVAVSKPACIRAVVYGSRFELRFFARPESGEGVVTLYTFHEDFSHARELVKRLCRAVDMLRKAIKGFVNRFSDIRVSIKIVTSVRRDIANRIIETTSRDFGASLRVSEFRNLDDSSIKVFSGSMSSSRLRYVSLRIVVMEKRSGYSSISITLETPISEALLNSLEGVACDLVGLARAIIDYSILTSI